MNVNVTREDIGLICDVQWFLHGYIVGMRHADGDCPFDKEHLRALDKTVGILKELKDKD